VVVAGEEHREESSRASASAAEQAEQAQAQAFGLRAVKFVRQRSGEMRHIRVRPQLQIFRHRQCHRVRHLKDWSVATRAMALGLFNGCIINPNVTG